MKLPRNSRKENVEGLPQNTKVFKYNIHWKINLKYIHTLSSNNDNKFYETFLKKLFFIKQTNAWIEKLTSSYIFRFEYNVKLLFQQNTICINMHQPIDRFSWSIESMITDSIITVFIPWLNSILTRISRCSFQIRFICSFIIRIYLFIVE